MRAVVLDASVGVKWFREESGTDDAVRLLTAHRDGTLDLVAPAHFCHELLAVAKREAGPDGVRELWAMLVEARLRVVELGDELVEAAAEQCAALDCSFYDALAPALARLLDAPLYSADARAHGAFPGVVLLG